jgi:hypothetical protein
MIKTIIEAFFILILLALPVLAVYFVDTSKWPQNPQHAWEAMGPQLNISESSDKECKCTCEN